MSDHYKEGDLLVITIEGWPPDSGTVKARHKLSENQSAIANAAHEQGIEQGRKEALEEVNEAAKKLLVFEGTYLSILDAWEVREVGAPEAEFFNGDTFTEALFAAAS